MRVWQGLDLCLCKIQPTADPDTIAEVHDQLYPNLLPVVATTINEMSDSSVQSQCKEGLNLRSSTDIHHNPSNTKSHTKSTPAWCRSIQRIIDTIYASSTML